MSRYIPIETPGGTVWTEIEETAAEGLVLTSAQDKALKSFQETTEALKENARFLLQKLEVLGPDEIEVSFGIKAGAEGGNTFFGLAKVSGEASYTVTVKWKSSEVKSS